MQDYMTDVSDAKIIDECVLRTVYSVHCDLTTVSTFILVMIAHVCDRKGKVTTRLV